MLALATSQGGASSFSWDGSIELEQRYFFDTQKDSINKERGQIHFCSNVLECGIQKAPVYVNQYYFELQL